MVCPIPAYAIPTTTAARAHRTPHTRAFRRTRDPTLLPNVYQAAATATGTKNEITLKGSVEIVTEFFGYAINRCGRRTRSHTQLLERRALRVEI